MLVWRSGSGSLKMFTFLGCKMADAWDCPVRTKNLSTKKSKNTNFIMLVWRSGSLKMFTFLGCKIADAWDCPVRTKNLSTKKTKTQISICWCGVRVP